MISEAEVREFLQAYERAANDRDFSPVAPMIHPDAVYRFNDGDFTGLEEIRGAFEKTWSLGITDERYWLTDIRVVYTDANSALLTYDYNWTGVGKAGRFQTKGRGTQLIVRNGERLQSIYEHLSS